MDLEKIKAQIAELKDKVVDNVDKHFNEYYIDDILDAKEYDLIDNPITDLDWYLYWIDIHEDLRNIFNLFFEKDNLAPDQYEVLCECVGLKRKIDKEITAIPNYKEYESIDVLNYFETKNIPSLTISESMQKNTIQKLYDFLISEQFICKIDFKYFQEHFYETDTNLHPIKWNKDAIRFTAFINSLHTAKILDIKGTYKDKKWELAKLHFRKSDNSQFCTNVLSNRSGEKNYKKYYKEFDTQIRQLLISV